MKTSIVRESFPRRLLAAEVVVLSLLAGVLPQVAGHQVQVWPVFGPAEMRREQRVELLRERIVTPVEDPLPWWEWSDDLHRLMVRMVTSDPSLNRWIPRFALELRRVGLADREHGRALMAIASIEGARESGPWVSDGGHPLGPSVGPMSALRASIQELGLWRGSRGDYAKMGGGEHVATTIGWAVAEYAAKVARAAADLRLPKHDRRVIRRAIRCYNGAGEQAEAYLATATSFVRRTFGE